MLQKKGHPLCFCEGSVSITDAMEILILNDTRLTANRGLIDDIAIFIGPHYSKHKINCFL